MRGRRNILVMLAILGSLTLGAQPVQPTEPDAAAVQPPSPAPAQPPPPPRQTPAPPAGNVDVQGQWVYTSQYGWVWMPYGESYTHVPPGEGPPSMYVYEPAVGWCWVDAPWVWGWGPVPFFGVLGTLRFGWWGNGYGHWYGFRGRYRYWGRPGWGHPYRGGWGAGRGWGGGRGWPRPRG